MNLSEKHQNPLVSIIVPVYNCAEYIQQCLDSVLAQTYETWELICVEHDSVDDSLAILRQNEADDERIRVLVRDGIGPGKARNIGIDIARGEFISFLDADDFMDEHLLEIVMKQATEKDAEIVVWDVWFYNNAHKRPQHPPMGTLNFPPFEKDGPVFSWRASPDNLFQGFQNWPWNKLFKASFIKGANIRFQEDITRTEDLMFTCTALVKAQRITTVRDRLTYYRMMRPGSSMSMKDNFAMDFFNAFLALKSFLENAGVYNELERSYLNWALSSTLYNLNTLRSVNVFCKVFDYLKASGLHELGISDCPKECFYNPVSYESMQLILSGTAEEYMFERMHMLDSSWEDGVALYDFADMDTRATREKLEGEIADLQKEKASVQEQLSKTQQDLTETQHEFDAVMNAAEQKVGSAICYIPRAIQRVFHDD